MKLERARAAQQARIDAWQARAAAARQAGRKLPGTAPAPPGECAVARQAQAELARARAAAAKDQGKDRKQPVRNITDPDARLMPVRGGGFIEGYNAQNVTSGDGLVIATELTQDPADTTWYEPMVRQAEDAARLITANRPAAAAAPAAGDPQAAGDPAGPGPDASRVTVTAAAAPA